MLKEGITHNLLISDPIMHPSLYQLSRANSDPDVFEIIFAGGMGMIVIVFTQYSIGMGICLDLDEAGTPAPDPLTFDLPFPPCLLHVMAFPASCIARATECLACRVQIRFGMPGLRNPNFNSISYLFMSKPLIEVGPGFPFEIITAVFPIVRDASNSRRGGGIDSDLRFGIIHRGGN
jgi:hypothetical protein